MRKSNNGFIQIIIIILAVILIAGGAYYFGTIKNKVTTVNPITSAQPSSSPIAKPDPIANWKTYTNDLMKYSFSYPSNWRIKDVGADEGVNKAVIDEKGDVLSYIVTSDNKDHLSLINSYRAEFCFELTCNPFIDKDEKIVVNKIIKIGDQDALFIKTDIKNKSSKYYFFTDNGTISMFQVLTSNQNQLTTIDQILSTFKFTK